MFVSFLLHWFLTLIVKKLHYIYFYMWMNEIEIVGVIALRCVCYLLQYDYSGYYQTSRDYDVLHTGNYCNAENNTTIKMIHCVLFL